MFRRALTGFRSPAVSQPGALACLLVALAWMPAAAHARCSIAIDVGEANALAAKVWRNESGGDVDKILWWNRGRSSHLWESVISSGIRRE